MVKMTIVLPAWASALFYLPDNRHKLFLRFTQFKISSLSSREELNQVPGDTLSNPHIISGLDCDPEKVGSKLW